MSAPTARARAALRRAARRRAGATRRQVAASGREARRDRPAAAAPARRAARSGTCSPSAGITLLVTREYEHLAAGARAPGGAARDVTLPAAAASVGHRRRPRRAASCTSPARATRTRSSTSRPRRRRWRRDGRAGARLARAPAACPVRSRFLPGLPLPARPGAGRRRAARQRRRRRTRSSASTPTAAATRVWWPRCIETPRRPDFGAQLPAAQLDRRRPGRSRDSFFSASADAPSARRPGPSQLPGRPARRDLLGRDARADRARADAPALGAPARAAGSGSTTAATARSASSSDGALRARSRGCPAGRAASASTGDVAFVGTSRVLPRFRQYAPGPRRRRAASAACTPSTRASGPRRSAACVWPYGNQIFAVEPVPGALRHGLPASPPGGAGARPRARRCSTPSTTPREEDRQHEQRLPPADDRRDVRERGQHHAPLPRRPPAAVRLPVRVADRHAARATTSSPRCSRSSTAGRSSRSTRRRPRTTRRSSTRRARCARARRTSASSATCRSTSPTTSGATLYVAPRRADGPLARQQRGGLLPRHLRRLEGLPRARGRETVYVGYSPIIVVDADKILGDLPQRARPARRAQPVVGLRRHQEAAVPLSLDALHARLDAEPVLRAALPRALPRPRAHRARRGRDGRLRRRRSAPRLRRARPRARADSLGAAELERHAARRGLSRGARSARRRRTRTGATAAELSPRGARGDPRARLAVPRDRSTTRASSRRMARASSSPAATGLRRREPRAPAAARRPRGPPARAARRTRRWRLDGDPRPTSQLHDADLADAAAVDARSSRRVAARVGLPPRRARRLLVADDVDAHGRDQRRSARSTCVRGLRSRPASTPSSTPGSSSEYGFKDHAPARDASGSSRTAHYAVTKVAATHFCRYTARSARGAPIRDAAALLGLRPVGGADAAHADARRARARGRAAAARRPATSRATTSTSTTCATPTCSPRRRRRSGARRGLQRRHRRADDARGGGRGRARALLGIEATPEWGSMPTAHVGHDRLGGRPRAHPGRARLATRGGLRGRLCALRRVVPGAPDDPGPIPPPPHVPARLSLFSLRGRVPRV